ncbi:MAG: hypothetical protein GF353_19105, partial [Candidatus Lokiarchaeota archaeon]|nr:hypothetical protein [Candidatus Lokiarchaeota archaeon]
MEKNEKKVKLYEAYSNADPIYEDKNLTVVRYELITRKILKRLDISDALVIIAISPLETHGNFLPLGSDYIEALMMNELIKELLKERKREKHYTVVEVPALPIGTGTLRGTKGSVDISHSVFRNIVEEYIEGYIKAGFTRFFLTSVHHGLIHALTLEEVSVKLMKKYKKNGLRIVSPLNWIVKKIYVDNPEKTWKEVVKDLDQEE